jgi:hypothetical protein
MKDPIRSIYLVETLEDRNNIPVTARYEGMLVYVKEDRGNYQLQWWIENDDRWVLVWWGVAGKGIYKIELIDTVGLEKIYRISFTDNTHFDYVVTDWNDGESASDILMQYSADNTIWNDVFTAWDKYIRFSTDWGDTYWEWFKFIGEDGTPWQDWDPGQDGVSIVDVYVDWSDLVFKYSDDSTTQIDNFRSVFNIPTDVSDLTDTTGLISWKEDSANKVTDLSSNDNVHFPTTKAVNTELDKKVDKDWTKVLSDENFTTDMKDKLAWLEGSHYRGLFTSLLDLANTITDAIPGDYADVDEGAGKDVVRYIRDVDDNKWVAQESATSITAAQVKTMYESNLNTNAFTDTEKSKLSQIEDKAQKNVQSNWNETDSGDDGFILNKPSLDIKDLPDSTNLKTTWNNKQNALGFTPENVDNKSGDIEPNKTSTTKYPTIKGIYDWVVSKLTGKQDTLTAGTNVSISGTTISATDTKYTAWTNVSIDSGNKISATDTKYSASDFDIANLSDTGGLRSSWTGKQDKLTAGNNVDITNDTISATDTTYQSSDFDIKDLADTTNLKSTWSGKQDSLWFTPENSANKWVANGYASLDANAKIPANQIPALAITETFVVANENQQLALTAEEWDVAIRTDESKTYIHNGGDSGTMADWTQLLFPTGGGGTVTSIATGTGLTGWPITSNGTISLDSTTIASLAKADTALQSWDIGTTVQANLISGTNIKTVWGTTLLWSGDIDWWTGNIGYKNIPQVSKSANYTLVLWDAWKSIDHPSLDANARTFTIPANSSVAYPVGTTISFSNMSSQDVTIAITTDTMYLAWDGATGSRTLAQYGVATVRKLTATTRLISGVWLT